jgi:hypothetical protein
MTHPDLPETKASPTVVSARAFERVWEPKGWIIADSSDTASESTTPDVAELQFGDEEDPEEV